MRLSCKPLIMLVLLVSFNGWSSTVLDPKKIDFAPLPDWSQMSEVPSGVETDESVDIHYLLFDKQVNIATEKKTVFTRLSQQVMNQQGLTKAAKLEIFFSPAYQKIIIHELHVLRNDKKLDRLVKDNIKLFQQETTLDQGMYQEGWQALVILDDVRVGDIVQWSYSIEGSNPVLGDKHFGSAYLNWGVPLKNYHYRLLSPEGTFLKFQLENSQAQIVDTTKNGIRTLDIVQTDLAGVQLEDQYPSWFNPYALFEYSQYRNWQEVNDWAVALYQANQPLPDESKKLLEKQSFDDKLEAVTFVTQWIQDNVRYFGIETGNNSHRPSLPGETLQRRYGDCKDKTVLLNTALRHLGIDAAPALVSTVHTQSLDKRLPSPGVFNHVISYFDYKGQAHWVDATMNGQKGSVTENSFPDLKWGFVVKANSHQLTAMKPISAKQTAAKMDIKQTFTVGKKDQPTIFSVQTRYSGWKARQMRSYISGSGMSAVTQDHINFYARYFDGISAITPVKFTEVADNQLLMEAQFEVKNLKKAVAGRNEVTLYATTIINELQLPTVRQRKFPYALSGELEINHQLNIIPQDMADVIWRDDAQPLAVNTPWFDYSVTANKNAKGVAVDYHYKLFKTKVDAKDFATYVGKIEEIDKSLAYSVWLHKDQSQQTKDRKQNVRNLLQSLIKKS